MLCLTVNVTNYKNWQMIFTVFTPTFNRAHTLHRVFASLCAQTFTDFEWVVVDDGSEDNTEALIAKWKKEAVFPLRYKKQQNSGKHIAINHGVALAKGEFFIIADSDDEFLPDALQIFYDEWMLIKPQKREKFTGVTGLCVNADNQIIGDKFPKDVFDSTPADTYYCYGISGEKWGFHRTSVLAEFPFPENTITSFYPEGLVWNRIGRKYLTRYINRPVRLYLSDAGNQLTGRSIKTKAIARIFYAEMLNEDADYLTQAPIRFLKLAIQGARFSFHQQDSLAEQLSRLSGLPTKFLWMFGLGPAYLIFLLDRVRCR